LIKAALSALHYSGADQVMAPITRGDGVIFMLHHVSPEPPRAFEPNRILKITPDFLDSVIRQVIDSGFDVLSLDELQPRLAGRAKHRRPFACFTFDDGYRDNLEHAYPIFKRHGVPFTIFVPTDYPDGNGDLWWLVLEEVIRRAPEILVQRDGGMRRYACATVAEKEATFEELYWWLRDIPEHRAREVVAELSDCLGIDRRALCRALVMTWDEIRRMATDPLVTLGAHTQTHFALGKLDEARARDEIAGSVARLEAEIGRPVRHFAYPYGDEGSAGPREFALAASLGLATAMTTRKGLVHSERLDGLTALPRVSLNGDFQQMRYVKVLLSGAPFAFLDRFKRSPKSAY
jgi:peptidoglycan/xylan/chitin deacetylase (PgdA/CDA1 family)